MERELKGKNGQSRENEREEDRKDRKIWKVKREWSEKCNFDGMVGELKFQAMESKATGWSAR